MINNTDALLGYLSEAAPRHVIGKDPFDRELIVDTMRRNDYSRAGEVAMSGISLIEMACWDIVGKALNQPVYRLMGGAVRQKIKPTRTAGTPSNELPKNSPKPPKPSSPEATKPPSSTPSAPASTNSIAKNACVPSHSSKPSATPSAPTSTSSSKCMGASAPPSPSASPMTFCPSAPAGSRNLCRPKTWPH